jgi:NADH-quinone oxidoreductase subunit C
VHAFATTDIAQDSIEQVLFTITIIGFVAAIPQIQLDLAQALDSRFPHGVKRSDDLAWQDYGLCLGVDRQVAASVFTALHVEPQFDFDMLIDVTVVDWLDRKEPRFELVYQLLSVSKRHRLCVKIATEEDASSVPSVSDLWPAALFLEREAWDMFGVHFEGHPDLRRILMYDEFEGHPLRKDYPLRGKQPRIDLRIPELRNTSTDLKRSELVALPTKRQVND